MSAKLSVAQRRAAKARRALRRSKPDMAHRLASEVLGFFRADRTDDLVAVCSVLLRKLRQIQRTRSGGAR
jgi:hypothetical protein